MSGKRKSGKASKSSKPRPEARRYYKRRVGLTAFQQRQLQARLRLFAPSEPWVEAQFKQVIDADEDGRPIVYRYHDPRVFPPGGKQTKMIRCPACGVLTPPNAFEGGVCLDHANHEGWGPSPSAISFGRARFYYMRSENLTDLEPDDEDSLRREIEHYEQANMPRAKHFSKNL